MNLVIGKVETSLFHRVISSLVTLKIRSMSVTKIKIFKVPPVMYLCQFDQIWPLVQKIECRQVFIELYEPGDLEH